MPNFLYTLKNCFKKKASFYRRGSRYESTCICNDENGGGGVIWSISMNGGSSEDDDDSSDSLSSPVPLGAQSPAAALISDNKEDASEESKLPVAEDEVPNLKPGLDEEDSNQEALLENNKARTIYPSIRLGRPDEYRWKSRLYEHLDDYSHTSSRPTNSVGDSENRSRKRKVRVTSRSSLFSRISLKKSEKDMSKEFQTQMTLTRIDQAGRFGSHNVLVNIERRRRYIGPLARDTDLDRIATKHAQRMASIDQICHSSVSLTLSQILLSSSAIENGCSVIGENVTKTRTKLHASLVKRDRKHKQSDPKQRIVGKYPTRKAHALFMGSVADRRNVLDRRFTSFGVGNCRNDESGILYVCQLYKG